MLWELGHSCIMYNNIHDVNQCVGEASRSLQVQRSTIVMCYDYFIIQDILRLTTGSIIVLANTLHV